MALSNTTVKAVYNGNGSNTTFAIPCAIIETASSEIQVYLRDESGVPATETLQTITTHYTLTGGGPDNVEMITAPTSQQKLVVIRSLPRTQNVSYTGTNAFPAESHELALDRLAAQIQEVNERVDRAPTLLRSSPLSLPLSLPEPEADKYIAWNSGGTALENKASTNSGSNPVSNTGGSSTDNAVPKFVGTAGDDIQNTGVIIDDSNNVTGINDLTVGNDLAVTGDVTGNVNFTGSITATGTVTGNSFELGRENLRAITTTATVTVSNTFITLDSSGGTYTVTMPSVDATHDGMKVKFKKITSDFNAVTIARADTDTIESLTSTSIDTLGEELTLVYDHANTNWIEYERKTQSQAISVTPTVTHDSGTATNYTTTFYLSRHGQWAHIHGRIEFTGADGTWSGFRVSFSGLTVNETILQGGNFWANNFVINGNTHIAGWQYQSSVNNFRAFYIIDPATPNTMAVPSDSAPAVWGVGEGLQFDVWVPISGWNA